MSIQVVENLQSLYDIRSLTNPAENNRLLAAVNKICPPDSQLQRSAFLNKISQDTLLSSNDTSCHQQRYYE